MDKPEDDTEESDEHRRRNIRTAAVASICAVLIVSLLGMVGFGEYQDYVDSNTFTITLKDMTVEIDKQYSYAVSRNGSYLINAYLDIEEIVVHDRETFYRVEQRAANTSDTFYWSFRDDGFYQFYDTADEFPQFYIPLPLRPKMTWTASIFPDEKHRRNKHVVIAEFTAGENEILDLPIGGLQAIEIRIEEVDGKHVQTLWISRDAPIAKLNIDTDDPSFIAELSEVFLKSDQLPFAEDSLSTQ